MKRRLIALSSLLLLTSCGPNLKQPSAEGSSAAIAGQSVTVLSGSDLQASGDGLSGTGAVLVDTALEDARLGQSYALDFSIADGGSLALVSHSDVELADGFSLHFVRRGSKILVSMEAGGELGEARGNFDLINASQTIKLQIDVHNEESPAHVMIWNRLFARNFTPANLLFNSERSSPGYGQGTRWGLKLKDAEVQLARASRPKSQG